MSDTWDQVYLDQVTDCEKRESRLTDWERIFIDSIRSQIEQGRRPTQKQVEILDRIWEHATLKG